MNWVLYHGFEKFPADELYAVLKLRQDVFIIEQTCIYDDIDGLDSTSTHLLLKEGDLLVAYSRLVPADKKFDEISIGRIVVNRSFRGQGLGRKIIKKSMDLSSETGHSSVRIEAQAHLLEFYESLGFVSAGEIYDLDGIPHLQMTRAL